MLKQTHKIHNKTHKFRVELIKHGLQSKISTLIYDTTHAEQ